MPTHHIIKLPPVGSNGMCSYIAAAFEANSDDVKKTRTLVRRRTFSVVHRAETMHVIMLMSHPVTAAEGLKLASHLAGVFNFPLISVAPSPAFDPQWAPPKLTVRDKIRVDLAVGGSLDIMALPSNAGIKSFDGVFVRNSVGTMTYAGGVS